jgi:DNA replication and repair protein RecF
LAALRRSKPCAAAGAALKELVIHIARLALSGFRNHLDTRLSLHPGLSIFQGENGHGKSNLLEAVYMLAIAKSPRTSIDRELINWSTGDTGGHVQILGVGREGDNTVQAQIDFDAAPPGLPGNGAALLRKALRINGIVRSASDFVGNINVVFFEAQDLEIVTGPPSTRRRYLDILISQSRPAYLKSLQRYSRVVTQRNHLLRRVREGAAGHDEMAFWNERLAYEGAEIVHQRNEVVQQLTEAGVAAHSRLTGGDELALLYRPALGPAGAADGPVEQLAHSAIESALADGMKAYRERELAQGVSVVGPHRDDVLILLNGQPSSSFASRGQARVIALALKLAEASVLRSTTGRVPVLALDDILSELDPVRRRLVLEGVVDYEQVLLTTAEDDAVAPEFRNGASAFSVEHGKVQPVA